MSNESTESIMEALPLPKLDAYYEAPKKQYWIKAKDNNWIQVTQEPVLLELEKLGYNTKARKGKSYSDADHQLAEIRGTNYIEYAGAVAGHMPGLKQCQGSRYLITRGPTIIEPKKGDWRLIKKLGERLFPDEQFPYVLGWSQNAVKGLLSGVCRRGQMLVLAGPAGVGKSFWQEQIITPMLGGRSAKPIQFMTGGTTFNADLISAEHLMLSDEVSKTDMKSRQAFGTAVKNFTVNISQRVHGKGDNGFMVESSHWISMSINDDTEALSIMPPLDFGIKDKLILLKCGIGINHEWPGDKSAIAGLEKGVREQLPAFIHYLLHEHVVEKKHKSEDGSDRYGISSYLNPQIVAQINSVSSGAHLEFLIDACWEQMAKERKKLVTKSEEIQLALTQHPVLGQQARALLNYPKACGRYLGELAEQNPQKYIKPSDHARPKLWVIDWSQ